MWKILAAIRDKNVASHQVQVRKVIREIFNLPPQSPTSTAFSNQFNKCSIVPLSFSYKSAQVQLFIARELIKLLPQTGIEGNYRQ